MPSPRVLQVGEYLSFVNNTLRTCSDEPIAVEGELSDVRIAQDKWISFDLKDEKAEAVLKCFMTVWQQQFPLEDGMRVQIVGQPKIYERYGTFKMNVQQIELVGEGALRQAYILLKKKLEKEGLFDVARKRSLPRFPSRIGLITSRDAAAYGDFIRILRNRWGAVSLVHANVHVQGREAVEEILSAFVSFNALPEEERPDILVLTRGGGGLEDLHAFNDERVARAVFQSRIPVVCGVGHERDESLCDFVADVRASTPSNAAERIVPDRREILSTLRFIEERMEERIESRIHEHGRLIESVTRLMSFLLNRECTRLFHEARQVDERFDAWRRRLRDRLSTSERVLSNLDPKRLLARGYSLITSGGRVVRDSATIDIGAEIHVELAKGSLDADIIRKNGQGPQKLFPV